MNKTIARLILVVLIILGLFLRLPGIWQGGFAFTYDAGRDLLAVRDLVVNHKFSLLGPTSGQIGIYYGPWWYWFLTIPFVIFKGNPVGVATFIALFGLLAVPLAYFWRERKSDAAGGLFLATIFSVVPFFVSATTQIWSPDLVVTGTLLSVILLSQFNQLTKAGLFSLGFMLVLLVEMEMVYGGIFLLATGVSLLLWQRKIWENRRWAYIVLGVFVGEFPRILFELRHQLLQTKILFQMLSARSLVVNYSDRLMLFWEKNFVVLPGQAFALQLAILAVVMLFLVISVKKHSIEDRTLIKILVTITGCFLIFTLSYPKEFWQYYLYGIPVLTAIIVSQALQGLTKLIGKKLPYVIPLIYLLWLINPSQLFQRLSNHTFVGDAAVFRNQLEILDYIFKDAGEDFNYIAYTPPQHDYTWQYLFWWKGRYDYGYGQTHKHVGKMYVIIEPDQAYPARIKDWLDLRKDDGIIYQEKQFASGIIVQTRLRSVD